MIKSFNIGSTIIAYKYIPKTADTQGIRQSRRELEKAAVDDIIFSITGSRDALTHTADGAPIIPSHNISISHSREMAVVAFDLDRKIGIDAEEWRPTLTRVSTRFLSDTEAAYIVDRDRLLKAWTSKEAIYKIIGNDAVDFRAAITLSPDLQSGESCGQQFRLYHTQVGDTTITLATKNNK